MEEAEDGGTARPAAQCRADKIRLPASSIVPDRKSGDLARFMFLEPLESSSPSGLMPRAWALGQPIHRPLPSPLSPQYPFCLRQGWAKGLTKAPTVSSFTLQRAPWSRKGLCTYIHMCLCPNFQMSRAGHTQCLGGYCCLTDTGFSRGGKEVFPWTGSSQRP